MPIYSGGDGAQTLVGSAGSDIMYGHGVTDTSATSGEIVATVVSNGFALPTYATSDPSDPGAMYVLEKDSGRVVRLDISTGAQTTFLDIPATSMNVNGERGLLGMAFHPDYATNGRFFVYVMAQDGALQVREYANAGGNPPVAAPELVQTVISIPHPGATNHNGGTILFGPDGYLYLGTGDGGGSNDPNNNAQNIESLLGKLIRIDVDGDDFPGDPNRNYGIPDSNPFVGVAGADEIFDLGLRNPFRMSFDSATGNLWIADVGQNRMEEINLRESSDLPGLNYGWRVFEGTLPKIGTPAGPYEGPLHEYDHTLGRSITGGLVYHGPDPALQGAYVFADFATNRIWALLPQNGSYERIELTSRITTGGDPISSIVAFATDSIGELYVVSIAGNLYRLDLSAASGDGGDNLSGGAGDDTIYGGAGEDQLFGGLDNDTLVGGSGDDILSGDVGADAHDGGAGLDAVSYATASSGVAVNLRYGIGANGDAQGDTYASIENATGSAFADTIRGTVGDNILSGGAGSDVLIGDFGDDTLLGGDGNDVLRGGAGRDVIRGDGGIDTADYSASAARVLVNLRYGMGMEGDADLDSYLLVENAIGSSFDDTLRGNGGANVLEGRSGADTLLGDAGNDRLIGGAGADVLNGGGGFDIADYSGSAVRVLVNLFYGNALQGDAAGDSFVDVENVWGSSFNDLIRGSTTANILRGGLGNDSLTGDGGADYFQFNVRIFGQDQIEDFQSGQDRIDVRGTGWSFSDVIFQTAGADTIITFVGNAGNTITLAGYNGALTSADFVF